MIHHREPGQPAALCGSMNGTWTSALEATDCEACMVRALAGPAGEADPVVHVTAPATLLARVSVGVGSSRSAS